MGELHFRYTYLKDAWNTLINQVDGDSSFNVSLARNIGVSLKDNKGLNIPAINYSDFVDQADMSNDTTGNYIIIANKNENFLRLRKFDSSSLSKIDSYQSSSALNSGQLYYYKQRGKGYFSKGNEIIYGNYYRTTLPDDTDEDILQHYNWADYVKLIFEQAYFGDDYDISSLPFSFNVNMSNKVSDTISRRFTCQFGIFDERYNMSAASNNDEFGDYVYLSSNETTNTAVLQSKERIYNGLYIVTDDVPSDNLSTFGAGTGRLTISKMADNSSFFSYGNANFIGNYDSIVIHGVMTGSREVKFLNDDTYNNIKVFNSQAAINNDLDSNDISDGFKELSTSEGDTTNFNNINIKSISTSRSIYSENIYNAAKQYIAGFNDITGKCICMTIESI